MADETKIQGIESGRAKFAWECVNQLIQQWNDENSKKKLKEYRSYTQKIPMYIKTNGLGATLAFMLSKKDKEAYKKNFLKNVFYPKPIPEFWIKEFENLDDDIQELEKLLNFKWNVEDLQKIINRNIQIEVFLGEQDKIINPLEAKNFFRKFADVFYIKQVGHILQNYDKI